MNESIQKIATGLKQAIQVESDGYYFYMMAARTTQDPQGVETFKMLAEEEKEHEEYLKKHYEHLLADGTLDPDAKLKLKVDLEGDSPIFSDDIKTRIGTAHYEMTALSIGIQLELNAVRHYQEQADATDDPLIKKFFQGLADWETRHYQALLRQQKALQQDYWASAGFSPF